MRAPEQVLAHLFCFLLSPFLCAGPDRILIESKQFINLKSCLRVAIQLVKTFNAHLLVSYWKKKSEVVKVSKKPFGQTLFFFRFACLFFTERKPYDNHLITFAFLVRFFKLKIFVSSLHLRFLRKKCGPRTPPSLVMYKVAHFHTGVAFTEKYPRKPESVSKISKMD